jgi:ribosomal protein RSM22 (predicted rRNA methylase)
MHTDDIHVAIIAGFEPTSQLDFGSGPGTAVLASRRVWGLNDSNDGSNEDNDSDNRDSSDSEQDDDHDKVLL